MNRLRQLRCAVRLLALALLVAVAGCGPRVSPAELGKIERNLPKLPGLDQPWPMPQLDKPSESTTPDSAPIDSSDEASQEQDSGPAPSQSPPPHVAIHTIAPTRSCPPPSRLAERDGSTRLPGPVFPKDPVVGMKVGATLPDGVP